MSPHCPTQIVLYKKMANEQAPIDIPQSRCLSRYVPMSSPGGQAVTEQIAEGEFYEIDHSKLPPRTPSLLLRSIRVVMVTSKSDQNVRVRYPSAKSLEAYFMDPSTNRYPEMDELFIMGPKLAEEVLVRQVPFCEFTRKCGSKAFWFLQTSRPETPPLPLAVCDLDEDVDSKLGTCVPRLQSSIIKSWGERRLVTYLKNGGKNSSDGQRSKHISSAIVPKTEMQEVEVEQSAGAVKFEEITHVSSLSDGHQGVSSFSHVKEEEIKKEREGEVTTIVLKSRKRKRGSYGRTKNIRTAKPTGVKQGSMSRAIVLKQDHDNYRWSAQRYENAKQELFSVMKAKHAVYTNPISRHSLRIEARKQIGDTGLLDHLLKHVVDTLAPGGTERFKRRWDSQGVMEYWLESADLDEIRKKAGVQDPFWTPPPGWSPGDPICNHNSECSAVISALKKELAQMRGEMQAIAAQNHEQTMSNLTVLSSLGAIESLNPAMFKERYDDLLKEKARREHELLETTKLLKKMDLLMKKQWEGLNG